MEAERPGIPIEVDRVRTTPLVRTEFFAIERLESRGAASFGIETSGQPEAWMVIAGEVRVSGPVIDETRVTLGTTALLPAMLDRATAQLAAGAQILRITLPSPIEGLLAGE